MGCGCGKKVARTSPGTTISSGRTASAPPVNQRNINTAPNSPSLKIGGRLLRRKV